MNVLFQTLDMQVGDVHIPSFKLSAGEWVALGWPSKFGSTSEKELYTSLCNASRPDFVVHSRISIVMPFEPKLNFNFKGNSRKITSIENILSCLPKDDSDMLRAELEKRNISINSPLDHLPGTLRQLARLCIASLNSKIIVFNMAGIDPLGIQKIYAYVATKLKLEVGFIELIFPATSNEQPHPITIKRLNASLKVGGR